MVKEFFLEIASHFDFETDRRGVAHDHAHVLMSFPPSYPVAKVVGILKRSSASRVFGEFPKVQGQLWGSHFWEQGYFFTAAGEPLAGEAIRDFIEKHSLSQDQLIMIE